MSRALGRYELLRPLARGGMGEVYLARRRAAGVEKWLVVKRMRPERAGDTRFLDLFMREARLSMSLAHQNIVPVFDFGRIDDQVFLAMERVEGKDLGSSLQKSGKGLPPMLAAFIAAECLQALDYAHRRKSPDGVELGIVHRDVTPRNVLLSWSGEVKLTDFGIAALAGDSPSRTAGTPAYMAPEQARGEDLDVRADLYALGLVLREALVGERARRGNDRDTVLEIAKQGTLEPWPAGFDTPLRAIIERATASDRTQRYPDARAMLEELDSYIVGQRAASKTESPARQLATWIADVWKDTRDDEGAMDAQIEAGELVSFLDDGPLDVMGTGTQRSALATAADDAASGPSTKVEVADQRAASQADGAAQRAASEPSVIVTASPSRRTSSALLVPLGIGMLALAVFVVWRFTREDATAREARTAMPPSVQVDAAPAIVAAITPDAAPIAEVTTDAAVSAPDAGVAVTADPRPRPRPQPRDGSGAGSGAAGTSAGSGSGSAAAPQVAATKRKVTIGTKPTWSFWTVDGSGQYSGTETIELTPGRHTIHFTGNKYFKADKKITIDVPDKDGFTYVATLEAEAPPP